MRLRRILILLTLFSISLAYGAPTTDQTVEEQNRKNEVEYDVPPVDFEKENLIESKNIPAVKKGKKLTIKNKRDSYYHVYQGALGGRLAIGLDLTSLGNFATEHLGGFFYQFPARYSPHWEMGFDFSKSSSAMIWGARKVSLNEKGSFRPFYKYGLAHNWKSPQMMASFVSFANYSLYGTVGFEDVLEDPKSIRLELELIAGASDLKLLFSLGLSWGL